MQEQGNGFARNLRINIKNIVLLSYFNKEYVKKKIELLTLIMSSREISSGSEAGGRECEVYNFVHQGTQIMSHVEFWSYFFLSDEAGHVAVTRQQ